MDHPGPLAIMDQDLCRMGTVGQESHLLIARPAWIALDLQVVLLPNLAALRLKISFHSHCQIPDVPVVEHLFFFRYTTEAQGEKGEFWGYHALQLRISCGFILDRKKTAVQRSATVMSAHVMEIFSL